MTGAWFYYVARSVAVFVASVAFAIGFAIVRWVAPGRAPRMLRAYLEGCGGGFLKFGQVLAMRFDLLPPAYYRELLRLLDRVRPLQVRRVRAILAAELGPRSADLRDLEDTPLGTASIAQVHGARLPDGSEVVVKVMRPHVARRLRADLVNLRLLARIIDLLGLLGNRGIVGLVDEVVRLTHEELDFRREAFQADLMQRRLAADDLDHRAPQIHFAYSTARVLTMERFRGVWVRNLIELVEAGDAVALARLAERGITPRRTARLLLHSLLTQCLLHRVFHADPHAANIVVFDGGTIGYIDFGMFGRLDEQIAGLQLRVIEGIAAERYDAAYAAMLATIEPLAIRDLSSFQSQIQDLFADWRMIAAHPSATVAEKSSGLFFLRVADLVRRARLQLPARMTRYYRAQIVCDMAIYGLDPQLDPTAEFALFFRELHARQLWDAVRPARVFEWWRTLAIDGPRAAGALVRWAELRLPRLGETYSAELSGFERAAALAMRTLQRGLWLAGVIVAGVGLFGDGRRVEIAGVPWWATAALAWTIAATLYRSRRALVAAS
jgi:ubiquinone biosynthesis protein